MIFKYFFLSLFCLFSSSLFAQDKGLFHLAPFQDKDYNYSLTYHWQDNEVSFGESVTPKDEIHEVIHELVFDYKYKFHFNWIGSIAIPFSSAKLTNPRVLSNQASAYDAQGFTEPVFKIYTRQRFPTENENLIDYYVSFRPSFMKRKVGESSQSFYTGRHILNLGLLYGAEKDYLDWEFQTGVDLLYYFEGEEEDTQMNVKRELEDYLETTIHFASWYFLTESWALRGLFDFTIHGNVRSRTQTESTTVQRGTSVTKGIGVFHQRGDYIYSLFFENTFNDYFLKRNSGNLEGDAVTNVLRLSFTKSY